MDWSSNNLCSLPLLSLSGVAAGVVGGIALALTGLFLLSLLALFPDKEPLSGSSLADKHCSMKSYGTLSFFSFLYSFAYSNIASRCLDTSRSIKASSFLSLEIRFFSFCIFSF